MGKQFAHAGYTFAIEINEIPNTMATINCTDTIFATVKLRGITLASLTLNGMTSFSDVVREVRTSIGNVAGLATLQLRNLTQGWSRNSALLF